MLSREDVKKRPKGATCAQRALQWRRDWKTIMVDGFPREIRVMGENVDEERERSAPPIDAAIKAVCKLRRRPPAPRARKARIDRPAE
jgi:hypothetical protein